MTTTATPDPDETSDDGLTGPNIHLDGTENTITGTFRTAVRGPLRVQEKQMHPGAAEFIPGELQELEVVVPLLAKARERLGQDVVVHIVGGMQVAGRLTEVDDDEATITVVKGDQQYDIALQSIAILEGAR